MKRILFAYPEVAPLFTNGGIGTYVFEASRLLAGSGDWEVEILADTSYGGSNARNAFAASEKIFAAAGVRLIDLNRNDLESPGWGSADTTRAERYWRQIERLHSLRPYHAIEFPEWKAPGFFVVRAKVAGGAFADTRLIVHLHSSTQDVWNWQHGQLMDRDDFYAAFMETYVKRHADILLSPTEFLMSPVREAGVAKRHFFRSGYPLATGEVPRENRIAADNRVITVACISRLELRKGQDLLASAIRSLAATPDFQHVRWIFCGRDSLGLDRDGMMSSSIRRILASVDHWEILPPKDRDELASWLASSVDVCVVPSRGDNYPNVVMEAARAGCRLLCSDAGGIPEMITDYGIEATIFPAGSSSAIEVALREVIQQVRCEPNSREKLAKQFEIGRQGQADRTLSTYESIALTIPRIAVPTLPAMAPLISIIIPYYNAHRYVADAVRSAFESAYPCFEVILVDDGSDDPDAQTALAALQLEFPALRILRKPNGGLGDARNAGLAIASGEYFVPLDADNELLPGMLEACARTLSARPELAYVTTYFECVRENDGSLIPWQLSPIAKPLGAVDPLLLLENTVGDALSMIRRSSIERVGGYSTSIYCFEDWDLWLKFRECGLEGDVVPHVHFRYRLRKNSMSRSLDAYNGIRLHQALLRHHEGLLRDQALAISTLLLQEYWPRWRPTGLIEQIAGSRGRLLGRLSTLLIGAFSRLGRWVKD